mmetsp:Transcript_31000/g.93106  ORF Transcript_31000/g.93106 Transcript_31000/m.93106 type:complete len:228 (-) Transcript_31000:290-973(-)
MHVESVSEPMMSGNACSTTDAPSTTSESTSRRRPAVASTSSSRSSSLVASQTAAVSKHLSISSRIRVSGFSIPSTTMMGANWHSGGRTSSDALIAPAAPLRMATLESPKLLIRPGSTAIRCLPAERPAFGTTSVMNARVSRRRFQLGSYSRSANNGNNRSAALKRRRPSRFTPVRSLSSAAARSWCPRPASPDRMPGSSIFGKLLVCLDQSCLCNLWAVTAGNVAVG